MKLVTKTKQTQNNNNSEIWWF